MITAKIKAEAAYDVADFLERMIPNHTPLQHANDWQDVAYALFAIANDTDAIVTDEEVADLLAEIRL